MKITLDANPHDAPCCLKIVAEDGRDILVQTDWDWPGVASTFGWSLADCQWTNADKCEHSGTDGTIPCPQCAMTVSIFLKSARDWMDDNDGAEAEDPGYFGDNSRKRG